MLCVSRERRMTLLYRAFVRPCNWCFVLLERSREPRRSFGATCAVGLGLVSMASCEAGDTRSRERCVRRVDFVSSDGVFVPTGPEVDRTPVASAVPWLLPELEEATGVDTLRDGRAALAAPTVGEGGVSLGTLGVVRAAARGRCGAAPRCTTQRKMFSVKITKRPFVVLHGMLCSP